MTLVIANASKRIQSHSCVLENCYINKHCKIGQVQFRCSHSNRILCSLIKLPPTINNRISLSFFSPYFISCSFFIASSLRASKLRQHPKMSKAVVYILIATAVLLYKCLSPLSLGEPKSRLNRRFGYKLLERAPSFDPLVTNNGREVVKKTIPQEPSPRTSSNLDSTTAPVDVAGTYQYLTSGGKLNTTLRLIILFPLLDREPKDGVVGFEELEAWITQRATDRLDYLTQAELDSKDDNGDLAVSFKEYLPQFSQKHMGKQVFIIGFLFSSVLFFNHLHSFSGIKQIPLHVFT